MFTDIVGSTKMKPRMSGETTSNRQEAFRREIKEPHAQIISDRLLGRGGRIVEGTGDGFFIVFTDPEQAVLCAVEIQEAMTAAAIRTPFGPLQIRIGLNSGQAAHTGSDYTASAADKAARVQSKTQPGQVFLSLETYQLVNGKVRGLVTRSAGTHELNGIGIEELFSVTRAGPGLQSRTDSPVSGVVQLATLEAEPASAFTTLASAARQTLTPRRPPAPAHCLGRDLEVQTIIDSWLQIKPGPLAILGAPGIGKTTVVLAALANARVRAHFNGVIGFVRCDSAKTASVLIDEIALTMDVSTGPQLETRLIAAFEQQPTLLILDNFETPWEADTLAVETLLNSLAGIPSLVLTITLRGSERPAGIPWADSVRVKPLAPLDAKAMFLSVAGNEFATDPTLHDLLTAMEGVPLALSLIAFLAEGEPDLESLFGRWKRERTRMLQRRTVSGRLESLAISVELSIRSFRMTDRARCLLSILSSLPDGVRHQDLKFVFQPEFTDTEATLRKVGLAYDDSGRLRVLTPIREHVLAAHTAESRDQWRAWRWYLELASGGINEQKRTEAAAEIQREKGNILAAFDQATQPANWPWVVGAAVGLAETLGYFGLGVDESLLARALDVAVKLRGALPPNWEASLNEGLFKIYRNRPDFERAAAYGERAVALSVGVYHATTMLNLGMLWLDAGKVERAESLFRQARRIYRDANDANHVKLRAACVRGLGRASMIRALAPFDGWIPEIVPAALLRARKLASLALRMAGDRRDQIRADALQLLADVSVFCHDIVSAQTCCDQASAIYAELGLTAGEISCIRIRGDIAKSQGNDQEGDELYRKAMEQYIKIGYAQRAAAIEEIL